MSLLRIIDNPLNDIALVTVLRSMIGGFDDNELIKIRIDKKNGTFYEAMREYCCGLDENVCQSTKKTQLAADGSVCLTDKEIDKDNKLKNKIKNFLDKIESFRQEKEYMPLDEFIWKIYLDTGYYNYVSLMPNGTLRVANLKILFEKAKQYESTSFKGLYNFINFIDKLKLSSKDMSGAKLIGENEDVIRIMSIHKSKGLEFPVVFLCGTGKKFNVQDLNTNAILLHQDIGLGPKYINHEEGIIYNTLAREAIKQKIKNESLSEEMRILYVALTRAKEKLIITGLEKDYIKSINKKEELLGTYKTFSKDNKIDKNIVQNYLTYLDWLELVYINSKEKFEDNVTLNVFKKADVLKYMSREKDEDKVNLKDILESANSEALDKIKNELEWVYKYKVLNNIQTKSSVSKIKSMKVDLGEKQLAEYSIPDFLKEKKVLSGAERGTLMHLCLQNLDERIDFDLEEINKMLENLIKRSIITEEEREEVNTEELLHFTKTNIWNEMKSAKEVQKEKPFYINIPAKEIYEEDVDDEILVQGVIDLYYITANDELVLVDYKTDKAQGEAELIEKYSPQLEIYKSALEKALHRKVDRAYIYSTYMGRKIEIF